jgi:PTH1 family peptidyl-tRNA hydrolase
MKCVIGIGNPGAKYGKTRHNAGFEVVDYLAGCPEFSGPSAPLKWTRKDALKAEQANFADDTVLLKSFLFVNNTGATVEAFVRTHKAPFENVLVVCDDVNLDFGKLRLRKSGSAGGHHGLESVIQRLDSTDFPRLRIGVRNSQMPKDLEAYVLSAFSLEEKEESRAIFYKAAKLCAVWARSGFAAAQSELSKLSG